MQAEPFTDFFTVGQRARAWKDGLRRAGITGADGSDDGTIAVIAAGDGPVLGLIACGAAGLTCRVPDGGGLWVVLPLGGGIRRDGVAVRDIETGPADGRAEITAGPHARMLFLRLRSEPVPTGLSPARARLLGLFLTAVADLVERLEPADLGAIEAAVTGMLASAPAVALVPARGAQASFQRIARLIEPRLPDPSLSLAGLAREQGVSERYLRRLFELSGTQFGNYVRTRRLEHCRADLDDPALATEPVASIGFRWGFNDPAHFSRAFREQFGLPPRAYRESRCGNCAYSGHALPFKQALAR